MKNLRQIEQDFKDKELFLLALTHRSWLNEHKGVRGSNERLEFLGDAVLEFIISKEIYLKFPDKEEGYLTTLRSNLVNTTSLARAAKELNFASAIYLSKGEEDGGGRNNMSILADTFEAIIGAIFLDRGLIAAEDFICIYLLADLEVKLAMPLKDPKSRLQEYVQAKGFEAPKYKVVSEIGPDHNKNFVTEVRVNNSSWGRGEGKSKSVSEQAAAEAALDQHMPSLETQEIS